MEVATSAALWKYSTMKVGGQADFLYHPQNQDELLSLISKLRSENTPWHVLGGGSNMLISSTGVKGAVIRTTQLLGIRTVNDDTIDADCGVRLPHIARHAAKLGLSGLEFAVGIPGTVGGAVVMNAGAHGSSMSELVVSATVLDSKSGKLKEWSKEELSFVYRNSAIDPEQHIVLSARLKLKPDSAEKIQVQTDHNEEYRWKTQPLGWPNLGSTFKNPFPDKSAGLLLDQSGAKLLKEGAAEVSALHANFVINTGGANSQDIVRLLADMQKVVYEKFAVKLHPEWKTLGEFSNEEKSVWK